MATEDDTLMRHLETFTRDAIRSEAQKKALRKAKLIEYTHGFWHLSDLGVERAKAAGYI